MLDIAKVEAAAAFWLTSTSAVVRQSCLKLIRLCVELHQYQPKQLPCSESVENASSVVDNDSSNSGELYILSNVQNIFIYIRYTLYYRF